MSTPIDSMIDAAVKQVPPPKSITPGLPYVTHEGIMDFMNLKIEVFILSDGRRMISEKSMSEFLKILEGK